MHILIPLLAFASEALFQEVPDNLFPIIIRFLYDYFDQIRQRYQIFSVRNIERLNTRSSFIVDIRVSPNRRTVYLMISLGHLHYSYNRKRMYRVPRFFSISLDPMTRPLWIGLRGRIGGRSVGLSNRIGYTSPPSFMRAIQGASVYQYRQFPTRVSATELVGFENTTPLIRNNYSLSWAYTFGEFTSFPVRCETAIRLRRR